MEIKNFKLKKETPKPKAPKAANLPIREPQGVDLAEKKQKPETDGRKNLPHGFKPGQSGNPAGRPKGVLLFKTVLLQEAEKQIKFMEKGSGKNYKVEVNKLIAQKLIELARAGNMKAIELYIERMDGKTPQPIQADVNVRGKIVFLPTREDNQ